MPPAIVLFEENSRIGKVMLNRPEKLNSIHMEMVVQLLNKLKEYENNPTIKLVILKGNGRAFCAGGDVKDAINRIITNGHWSFTGEFYRKQLTLDYLLATYEKPLVVLIDGIVMGGGAGLSMHAKFRIVTENTVFAMPEASIGLFPDVGASHFLSRLPGYFGEYLGLTGAQLDGTEMLASGLATHFVLSKDLDNLEKELDEVDTSDISSISEIINKFAHQSVIKQDSAYRRLDIINECFSKETVEEILSSLENFIAKKAEKWMVKGINFMKSASPTSLKIFLRSIREGRRQKLEQCLVREFNILCHVIRSTVNDDFYEGSRAMLIDKDRKPKWQPPSLELVSQEMVNQFFSKVYNDYNDRWESLQLPTRSNLSFKFQSML